MHPADSPPGNDDISVAPPDTQTRDLIRDLFTQQRQGARDVLAAHAPLPTQHLTHSRWSPRVLCRNPSLPWERLLSAARPPFTLSFPEISRNEGAWWTEKLIAGHAKAWSWAQLSKNPALPWSQRLAGRQAEHIDWPTLCLNPAMPWTRPNIQHFKKRVVVSRLAANVHVAWTSSLVRKLHRQLSEPDPGWQAWMEHERPESVAPGVTLRPNGWEHLQQNPAVDWEHVLPQLPQPDWPVLSANKGLPWTSGFIAGHAKLLSWSKLSGNRGLPWTPALLDRFAGRWSLWELSGNPALPWADNTPALLRYFEPLSRWNVLSTNPAVRWTTALLDQYGDRLSWGYRGLSSAASLSAELLDTFADRLDWDWGTTTNPRLPWSGDLIARHAGRWNWERLGFNRALPWSPQLVARFASRWKLGSLARHSQGWQALAPALGADFIDWWCRQD